MKGSVGDINVSKLKTDIRILVINPGPIYPIMAMNQLRTHNMIQSLAKDFSVALATPVNQEIEKVATIKAMESIKGVFYDFSGGTPIINYFKKRLTQIMRPLAYFICGYDREYFTSKTYENKIIDLIKNKNYKIIISNYWEGSSFYCELDYSIYKILDPHYAVAENWEVFKNKKNRGFFRWFEHRKLTRSTKIEKAVIEASDLLLPLSKRNQDEFMKIAPHKPMVLIPDGSDVECYSSFPVKPDPNTILFYGAMSSPQNINAFKRFYKKIYPTLKMRFPELRLLVVGNKPADDIIKLHNGKDIIVTGFVDDVRTWLTQAWIKIIPLELGSGFRGRVIELMAMGIPVIGTHNALDSIEMENGKQGFISDSDDELIKYCLKLLNNHDLRKEMSRNAIAFVKEKYSLEATFGKLNTYLKNILTN